MFDQTTRTLIGSAPPLEDLQLDRLPETLTRAYTALVALRVQLRGAQPSALPQELSQQIAELRRLAQTYESMACLLPHDSPHRAPCAFVAGTARKLVHQADEIIAGTPVDSHVRVGLDTAAIPALVSASLLFLLAGAYPDALEVARRLEPAEPETITGRLVVMLRSLVLGEFRSLSEATASPWPLGDVPEEDLAIFALWRRLEDGLRALGRQLQGAAAVHSQARAAFQAVRRLAVQELAALPGQHAPRAFRVAAGPHHLASLLDAATDLLTESATRLLPAPPKVDENGWRAYLRAISSHLPFLWANHQAAVQEGVLAPGVSATVSFPTGAGKSTLIVLKIASCLAGTRRSVLVLAPTVALVDQFRRDLEPIFPDQVIERDLAEPAGASDEARIVILTPERTLALLGIDPAAFSEFGLIVLDECHHLGVRPRDRRCLDAMLCLLNLLTAAKVADLFLVSAMMANGKDLAEWVQESHGRRCISLDRDWKPTRQARGCVVFMSDMIGRLRHLVSERRQHRLDADGNPRPWSGKPRTADERDLTVRPYAFFCLRQSWSTQEQEDYSLQLLLQEEIPLRVAASKATGKQQSRWYLTPNRNVVAAAIGANLAASGIRTMILAQQARDLASLAEEASARLESHGVVPVELHEDERELLDAAAEELGDSSHVIGLTRGRVAIHHALLLAPERRFSEALFARKNGVAVLAVSPTLSQGVNLPAEAVVIAGDDQWDESAATRRDLGPEELLNAAGRAGRAGSKSAGVVLVVPGKLVPIDASSHTLGERWFQLQQRVFSKSDQCLSIDDPLAAWLDRLQTLGADALDEDAQYVLRRLPVGADNDMLAEGSAATYLGRSFAAFRARRAGAEAAFAAQVQHALQLRAQIAGASQETWQLQVASRTGLALGAIDALSKALPAEALASTVVGWVTGGSSGCCLTSRMDSCLSEVQSSGPCSQGSPREI